MSARYFKNHITNFSAFTLVELLVVITILGILASVALVAFTSAQIRSRDAQRKSDLSQTSRALELFNADYGKYPNAASGIPSACPFTPPSTWNVCSWGSSEMRDTDSLGNTKTTYMKTLPKDPVSSQTYFYRVDSTNQKYQLFTHLENTQDQGLITTSYICGGSYTCNFGVSSPNTSPTDTSW